MCHVFGLLSVVVSACLSNLHELDECGYWLGLVFAVSKYGFCYVLLEVIHQDKEPLCIRQRGERLANHHVYIFYCVAALGAAPEVNILPMVNLKSIWAGFSTKHLEF